MRSCCRSGKQARNPFFPAADHRRQTGTAHFSGRWPKSCHDRAKGHTHAVGENAPDNPGYSCPNTLRVSSEATMTVITSLDWLILMV